MFVGGATFVKTPTTSFDSAGSVGPTAPTDPDNVLTFQFRYSIGSASSAFNSGTLIVFTQYF